MKFAFCSAVIAAALVAGADVSPVTAPAANTFGVLRIDSSAKETIVAVPWVAADAAGATDIKVADIVKTDNLNNGDMLLAYIGGQYKAWILSDGAWAAVQTAGGGSNGLPNYGVPAVDQALSRGNAIILIRNTPGSCFYILGQVGTGSPTTSITAGSTGTPVWNLIAPPSAADVSINSASGWDSSCANGDVVYVPASNGTMLQLTYKNGAWGYDEIDSNGRKTGNRLTTSTIPAGTGVMYKSVGGTNFTINW